MASGLLQAAGFCLWMVRPGFGAFAGGFVLWGLGGALASGSQEALLYDGLSACGAEAHYASVSGRVASAALLAQLPAAGAATVLVSAGGYRLAGWVSVVACLLGAVLAWRLPEAPGRAAGRGTSEGQGQPGYLRTLRMGLSEAVTSPELRAALIAVALLGGLDGIEEYFTLLARDWGVATAIIPLAVLGLPLAGAVGAVIGGRANRMRSATLAVLLGTGVAVLGLSGLAGNPASLAGVAFFYLVYRGALVVVDARLQQRIEGPARATMTSAAALGAEVVCLLLFGAWALGGLMLVVAMALGVAIALPRLLPR